MTDVIDPVDADEKGSALPPASSVPAELKVKPSKAAAKSAEDDLKKSDPDEEKARAVLEPVRGESPRES